MALSEEEVKTLKNQLREQVKNMPAVQKEKIFSEIEAMSVEALEEMLNQQRGTKDAKQKGIFRMIVDGEVPSKKISENDFAIAVISKKAISKGHVLIIPKSPIRQKDDFSKSTIKLAKDVARKIKSKLKVDAKILKEGIFGEFVINVVPIYLGSESLVSDRYEANDFEIDEMKKILEIIKKKKVVKIKKITTKKHPVLKLKRRIP